MHAEDLAEARKRLNKVWVPFEQRFSGMGEVRTIDPSQASPPPVDEKVPYSKLGRSMNPATKEIGFQPIKSVSRPKADLLPLPLRSKKRKADCGHNQWRKIGHDRFGRQRKRCTYNGCGRTVVVD